MKIRPGRNIIALLMGVFLSGCASSPSVLTPHGTDASRVAFLTWLMFAIAAVVLIAITVLLWMAYQRSRREQGDEDIYRNDQSALRNVVIGGGVVPLVVLVVVMGIGIGIEQAGYRSSTAPDNQITIEVIGHQWWWEIHYAGQNFETANEIHIPAGQPVTVHVTTADVIHSFWIPELHGKIDLIPGQTNTITLEADKAGVYRGECAEFCGAQHAHMAFLVIADTVDDFKAWIDDQNAPGAQPKVGSLEQTGEQAFLGSSCVYCHTVQDTNASGHIGPDLTHLASRRTIGADLLPNTPGNLAGWIINSQMLKPENHMPPMDLNGDQLQALLAYLATLK